MTVPTPDTTSQASSSSSSSSFSLLQPQPSAPPPPSSDSPTPPNSSTPALLPPTPPTRVELFDDTLNGTLPTPFLPKLSSDPPGALTRPKPPTSLPQYIVAEGGPQAREARLRALWERLPSLPSEKEKRDEMWRALPGWKDEISRYVGEGTGVDLERAERMRELYFVELVGRCEGDGKGKGKEREKDEGRRVDWEGFLTYANEKEKELWHIFHDELDLDGNGHLEASEWSAALSKAGISLDPRTLSEFMTFLTSSSHSRAISFPEFRDFLLLMPRKASTAEIYRYYEIRKFMGDDGRGAARVNMEGDVSLSAEDKPPQPQHDPKNIRPPPLTLPPLPIDHEAHPVDDEPEDEEDDEPESIFGGHMALKFLLAGGVAGVVSRTATAPFDRLKVYLITSPPELVPVNAASATAAATETASRGTKAIISAIHTIYHQGGLKAFWVGNGLNTAKIFPESAIKFMSYETSKRMFARYYDHVEDSRDISGVSRFISGGIGGMTSQLAIYPIETLKTQMMSTSEGTRSLIPSMQRVWALGGLKAYYRGLAIGLVGVFPYSAIDMSTFEALKQAYIRSTGREEPGVLALLAFGSISGSVGATSVYPLNLVRTRLQASGSSGHPQRYTGIVDVATKTYQREGWKGFYKGLVPTLAKVVPAVSISYVVYESTKRKLGVA